MLFKNTFQENRKNISNYFKEGADVKPWEFGNELVFTRLDKFVERLQVVEVNLLNGCIPILFLIFLSTHQKYCRWAWCTDTCLVGGPSSDHVTMATHFGSPSNVTLTSQWNTYLYLPYWRDSGKWNRPLSCDVIAAWFGGNNKRISMSWEYV